MLKYFGVSGALSVMFLCSMQTLLAMDSSAKVPVGTMMVQGEKFEYRIIDQRTVTNSVAAMAWQRPEKVIYVQQDLATGFDAENDTESQRDVVAALKIKIEEFLATANK